MKERGINIVIVGTIEHSCYSESIARMHDFEVTVVTDKKTIQEQINETKSITITRSHLEPTQLPLRIYFENTDGPIYHPKRKKYKRQSNIKPKTKPKKRVIWKGLKKH